MQGAFSWLSSIITWFGKFFPRFVIVRKTHAGLKFKHGKVKTISPGLVFFWPVTTEIEVIPIVRRSLQLGTQALWTKEGWPIAVALVVVYEINDVVKALSETFAFLNTIEDVAQISIVEILSGKTREDLKIDTITEQATTLIAQALKPFGVLVTQVGISSLSVHLPITQLSVDRTWEPNEIARITGRD